MTHSPHRSPKLFERLTAWRKAECVMRQVNAEDSCDDRVSENIFDAEDERAEVDVIVRGMLQGAH